MTAETLRALHYDGAHDAGIAAVPDPEYVPGCPACDETRLDRGPVCRACGADADPDSSGPDGLYCAAHGPGAPHEFAVRREGDRRCDAAGCNLLYEEHAIPVVIARIETAHFEFEGVGNDEDEARSALLDALQAHTREQAGRVVADWWVEYLDDTNVRTIWPGHGYRDRELVS